jgi:hypothetical protein
LKPIKSERPEPEMTDHYKREYRVAAITVLKNPHVYPKGSKDEAWARQVLEEDINAKS